MQGGVKKLKVAASGAATLRLGGALSLLISYDDETVYKR